MASNSNAMGRWLGDTPLFQVVRSPRAAAPGSRLLSSGETDPALVEGARLLDAYSTSGGPPVVLVRAERLTAVLLAARRGNALPIVNPNQDGLHRRARAQESGSLRPTDFQKEPSSSRRPCSCGGPPESFAQLDPIRNRLRFGDYFVSRSYAALAERFDLRVLARGRYGYVLLQVRGHR